MILLDLLYENNFIKFDFNGKYIIDFDFLLANPQLTKQIAVELYNYFLCNYKNISLITIENSSIPLISTISSLYSIPILLLKNNNIIGSNHKTKKVVLINNISIPNYSIENISKIISKHNYELVDIINIVNIDNKYKSLYNINNIALHYFNNKYINKLVYKKFVLNNSKNSQIKKLEIPSTIDEENFSNNTKKIIGS